MWRNVGVAPWLLARRLRGVGLELERTGTGEVVRARRARPVVRLIGVPGELLLYVFGRQSAARADLVGPPDAVAAVERVRFGV